MVTTTFFELFLEDDIKADKETHLLMNRFVNEVSLTVNKSLSLSINQSIDHIRKQYGLVKKNRK